ncbi:DUF58 domain-containing protein [Zooshikella marina]|nr:DUF58 domain-containing protein [Zooshikella ganghwensis]
MMRTMIKAYFGRWLDQRIPPSSSIFLNQKRIFILPTRTGYFFILIGLAVFFAAVNYENSMSFMVAFFLASLFLVCILHTYANLAGLEVTALYASKAHVGDDVGFTLQLQDVVGKPHESIRLFWQPYQVSTVSLTPHEKQSITVFLLASQRGYFRPGRLCIETYYPLGLLRAWTWLDLESQALIYPKPIACPLPACHIASSEGDTLAKEGVEDFTGLRSYQPGDGLRHIAWKHFWKSDDLLTKQFSAYTDMRLWLDWEQFTGASTEERLSFLCYWCLQCEQHHQDYGLRIPNVTLEPARGPQHLTRCLTALALFGVSQSSTIPGRGK